MVDALAGSQEILRVGGRKTGGGRSACGHERAVPIFPSSGICRISDARRGSIPHDRMVVLPFYRCMAFRDNSHGDPAGGEGIRKALDEISAVN